MQAVKCSTSLLTSLPPFIQVHFLSKNLHLDIENTKVGLKSFELQLATQARWRQSNLIRMFLDERLKIFWLNQNFFHFFSINLLSKKVSLRKIRIFISERESKWNGKRGSKHFISKPISTENDKNLLLQDCLPLFLTQKNHNNLFVLDLQNLNMEGRVRLEWWVVRHLANDNFIKQATLWLNTRQENAGY